MFSKLRMSFFTLEASFLYRWVMTRQPGGASTTLLVAVAALVVSACSGAPETVDSQTRVAAAPSAGGSLTVVQGGEPRTLDPAALINAWMSHSLVGNALYGTLMTNDVETFDIEYRLATGFTTADGGRTFDLTLRPNLTFTDGTPFDADAVKFNWDRMRDPATASPSLTQAAQIASTTVRDPLTLRVEMLSPTPHFAQSIVASGMNWIGSPAAIEQGQSSYDANPVGAGPFTLGSWRRQDQIELEKNPGYWDAPKPYLDRLVIHTVPDTNQRINAITTGDADIAVEASWLSLAKARSAGFDTVTVPTGGGQFIALNTRRGPFDDQRARRALALAVDLDAVNSAVYNGEGEVPDTLFPDTSQYHTDISLGTADHAAAQRLFDELDREGKRLSFTFLAYASVENRSVAESVQAQLSLFDNVDVKVETVEFATGIPRVAAHDFDAAILSATIGDPDASLWSVFHGASRGNFTGIDDPELNAALDAGRVSESMADRVTAYEIAQRRIASLGPALWYTRSAPSVVTGPNVQGVQLYGVGSLVAENLWTTASG